MKPIFSFTHLVEARTLYWKYILSIWLFFVIQTVFAQDIHLSHIHASPLNLNPAMAGIFNGDLRLICNYKSQWNEFTNGYRSFFASADMKLNRGLSQHDDIAIGFQAIGDKSGDLDFSVLSGNFTFAYLKSINKEGSHILAIGLNAGLNQHHLNLSKARTKEQVDPYLLNAEFDSNIQYFDLSGGISWFMPLSVDDFLYLGASTFHLNRARVSFLRSDGDLPDSYFLFRRTTMHGGASLRLNQTLTIKPSFIYLHQGPHEEINFGTFFSLNQAARSYIKPEYTLHIGAWYRWSLRQGALNRDALIASIRYDTKSTVYSFSYDINVSDLVQASRAQGGPELSIIHYLDFFRPERNNWKVKCPEF